jgi:hypothetical protein
MKARTPEWSTGDWVEFEHGGRLWRMLVEPDAFDPKTPPDAFGLKAQHPEEVRARTDAARAVIEAINRGAP